MVFVFCLTLISGPASILQCPSLYNLMAILVCTVLRGEQNVGQRFLPSLEYATAIAEALYATKGPELSRERSDKASAWQKIFIGKLKFLSKIEKRRGMIEMFRHNFLGARRTEVLIGFRHRQLGVSWLRFCFLLVT